MGDMDKQGDMSKRKYVKLLRLVKPKQRKSTKPSASASAPSVRDASTERASPESAAPETGGSRSNSSKRAAEPLVEPPSKKVKELAVDIGEGSSRHQRVIEMSSDADGIRSSENSTSSQPVDGESNHRLNDSERTGLRYAKAVERLQKSLKLSRRNWKEFTFTDGHGVSETISQMHEELETVLQSWKTSRENPNLWSKAKHIAAQLFAATSPFFKNVLSVAKSGQSV